MDYWPWGTLTPRRERWWLQGVAINGGVNVGGNANLTRTDGGGLWVGEQSFLFSTRQQIQAARAMEAILDGGSGKVVAWSFEAPFAPSGAVSESATHSDGSPFGDGSLYSSEPAGAVVTADCALRSTTIPIEMLGGPLIGGEHFSIVHPVHGCRKYRVARVGTGAVEIRPPLRETVPAGVPLYFKRVGVVCRLGNPDDFFGALDTSRIVEATARWIEAF